MRRQIPRRRHRVGDTHPTRGGSHHVVRDRESGATETLKPKGFFVFVGLSPNSDWLPATVARDRFGFLVTSKTLETSIPGVFAAGDVREGATAQAASAAGEGATVALMVREYLKEV